MTENRRAASESMSDGLIVRGWPPFAMTPTSLLRNRSVSSHAVRLWSVLASYTYGDQATDRPSRSRLATDVGWKSPRSVDTYLTELQNAGYLTVQRRWRPDGGKARNLYILEWEPQGTSSAERVDRPSPLPVGDSVSAAQTHAQDSAHGVRQVSERWWITRFRSSGPCARFCAGGHDARHPGAGFCAYPCAESCASRKRTHPQERTTTNGRSNGRACRCGGMRRSAAVHGQHAGT